MFPNVNGFHYTFGHVLFLSLFGLVIMTIAAAVLFAMWRTRRQVRANETEKLRWHTEFDDLPLDERRCRHELAARVETRVCPNAFDCSGCQQYAQFAVMPTHAPEHAFGLDYPPNRLYHRGHAWVERESDDVVRVGLDDLASRLVGDPDSIELPAAGTRVEANGAGWRMEKNGHEFRVLSPVDGEVLETGGRSEGWYLRLRIPHGDNQTRHLLRGPEVTGWLMRELERLQIDLAPAGAAPSLADGGTIVDGLMDQLPQADWSAVLNRTFLEA